MNRAMRSDVASDLGEKMVFVNSDLISPVREVMVVDVGLAD